MSLRQLRRVGPAGWLTLEPVPGVTVLFDRATCGVVVGVAVDLDEASGAEQLTNLLLAEADPIAEDFRRRLWHVALVARLATYRVLGEPRPTVAEWVNEVERWLLPDDPVDLDHIKHRIRGARARPSESAPSDAIAQLERARGTAAMAAEAERQGATEAAAALWRAAEQRWASMDPLSWADPVPPESLPPADVRELAAACAERAARCASGDVGDVGGRFVEEQLVAAANPVVRLHQEDAGSWRADVDVPGPAGLVWIELEDPMLELAFSRSSPGSLVHVRLPSQTDEHAAAMTSAVFGPELSEALRLAVEATDRRLPRTPVLHELAAIAELQADAADSDLGPLRAIALLELAARLAHLPEVPGLAKLRARAEVVAEEAFRHIDAEVEDLLAQEDDATRLYTNVQNLFPTLAARRHAKARVLSPLEGSLVHENGGEDPAPPTVTSGETGTVAWIGNQGTFTVEIGGDGRAGGVVPGTVVRTGSQLRVSVEHEPAPDHVDYIAAVDSNGRVVFLQPLLPDDDGRLCAVGPTLHVRPSLFVTLEAPFAGGARQFVTVNSAGAAEWLHEAGALAVRGRVREAASALARVLESFGSESAGQAQGWCTWQTVALLGGHRSPSGARSVWRRVRNRR